MRVTHIDHIPLTDIHYVILLPEKTTYGDDPTGKWEYVTCDSREKWLESIESHSVHKVEFVPLIVRRPVVTVKTSVVIGD